jgi:hypothetical protein
MPSVKSKKILRNRSAEGSGMPAAPSVTGVHHAKFAVASAAQCGDGEVAAQAQHRRADQRSITCGDQPRPLQSAETTSVPEHQDGGICVGRKATLPKT